MLIPYHFTRLPGARRITDTFRCGSMWLALLPVVMIQCWVCEQAFAISQLCTKGEETWSLQNNVYLCSSRWMKWWRSEGMLDVRTQVVVFNWTWYFALRWLPTNSWWALGVRAQPCHQDRYTKKRGVQVPCIVHISRQSVPFREL